MSSSFPTRESTGGSYRRPIHMHQRLAVYVDVQNMFYSAKALYQRKLNFESLLRKVVTGRELVRAIAYIVQAPDVDQSGFINFLHQIGFEVKSKELKVRPDGSAKGDWDMGIAIDTLSMSDRIDVMALVSGDGDFCELVRHLKAKGLRCEVYAFPESTAEELRYTATEYIPLDSEVLLYE
ncbi:NYN domain-containing protein [bacterium]|nr:NYN domain-containing protein [bacterium]